MTTTVETTTTEPQVFVGCTRCAAEGHPDRGVWMPASEAGDAITDEVHRGRVVRLEPGVDLHVDSLAVLEVRGFPVTTPMSIERAVQWGETYEEVGKAQSPAFCAWIESGAYVEDGDGVPSVPAFWERYCGEWADFEDYAAELVEETGLQRDWPEEARRFFDLARWARDERQGYTVVDAPDGANVALLLGFTAVALRSLRVHRAVVIAAGLGLLAVFVVVVGPEPSVLRAAVMGALGAVAVLLGRGRQAFALLAIGGTALLVAVPSLSVESAFHLSLAATAGIVLAGSWGDRTLHGPLRRVLPDAAARWLSASLAVTLAAHLACQPVLLAMTGELSAYAVLANLVAAPAVAPVTVLGTLAAALVLPAPAVAAALVWLVQWPAAWIGVVAHAAAGLPGALRPWPSGALGVGLGALLTAATLAGFAAVLVLERRRHARVRRVGAGAPLPPERTPALVLLAAVLVAAAVGGVGAVLVPRPARPRRTGRWPSATSARGTWRCSAPGLGPASWWTWGPSPRPPGAASRTSGWTAWRPCCSPTCTPTTPAASRESPTGPYPGRCATPPGTPPASAAPGRRRGRPPGSPRPPGAPGSSRASGARRGRRAGRCCSPTRGRPRRTTPRPSSSSPSTPRPVR